MKLEFSLPNYFKTIDEIVGELTLYRLKKFLFSAVQVVGGVRVEKNRTKLIASPNPRKYFVGR